MNATSVLCPPPPAWESLSNLDCFELENGRFITCFRGWPILVAHLQQAREPHDSVRNILTQFNEGANAFIFCYFVYVTIESPSEDLFWTNFIALPSSRTTLVYFTIQAPSAGFLPEWAIPFLPHWKRSVLKWKIKSEAPPWRSYLSNHFWEIERERKRRGKSQDLSPQQFENEAWALSLCYNNFPYGLFLSK